MFVLFANRHLWLGRRTQHTSTVHIDTSDLRELGQHFNSTPDSQVRSLTIFRIGFVLNDLQPYPATSMAIFYRQTTLLSPPT